MQPKILLFDIENTPNLGWYYDRYQKFNIVANQDNWFMLSFAYKWFGENDIHVRTLRDYPGYSTDRRNDRSLVSDLWGLLSAADVTIAHNGIKHDLRKANARFVYHRLPPPTASRVIDTFKAAKKHFGFEANHLAALGEFFHLGGKVPTTGFELHQRVMEGDSAAWDKLVEYNRRDVELLEQVYLRLRPYMTTHPKLTDFGPTADACPTCLSNKIVNKGFNYGRTGRRQRFRCGSCGADFSSGPILRRKENGEYATLEEIEDINVLQWKGQGETNGSNRTDGTVEYHVGRSVLD